MANQLGTGTVSPREYNQHARHTKSAKRTRDDQRAAFLSTQATRLSTTAATIEAKLKKYTAAKIISAAALGDLP